MPTAVATPTHEPEPTVTWTPTPVPTGTPTPTATPLPTPNPNLPPDTLALIALFDATDGPNWKANTGWRSDAPVSTWHGVQTDDRGRVVQIDLTFNDLSGPIPSAIGQLTELKNLTLSINQLTGAIPAEIGQLVNLEALDLADNMLSGTIPTQLGRLAKLSNLLLGYNDLSGTIPPELTNMSQMGSLNLQANRLSGPIPARLANLSRLYGLDLSGNEFVGNIPEALAQLTSLQYLDVSNNRLSGEISDWPNNLSEVNQLRVSDNDFTGCVPSELRTIPETDILYSQLSYCGDSTKHQPASPDFVEWIMDENVSPSEERAARLGLQWVYEYGLSVGWPIAGETITIHVDDELGLAQTLANEDGIVEPGEVEEYLGFIRTVGGFADDDANYNRASDPGEPVFHDQTAATVAHENLHIMFQRDLVGYNSTRHGDWSEPHWWTEGMAKIITQIVIYERGTTFEERRRWIVDVAAADRCNVPLADLEIGYTYDLFLCGYDVGALAVELLGSKVGFRNLVKLYTERQPGWTWEQTFKHAFDMTLDAFYSQFAQHRSTGFPAVQHPIVAPAQ